MRIENWCVTSRPTNPYQPPELQGRHLHGKVYGHPHFPDGEELMTSRIALMYNANEVVTKSGSVYELGEVDPAYEAQFPDAQKRLFAQFGVENQNVQSA